MSSSFIDLDRTFDKLDPSRAYDPGEFDILSLFGSGRLKWPDLLERSRVLVLGDASSGKSEEFRQRERLLRKKGWFAFATTLERLADAGLAGGLCPEARSEFQRWLRQPEPGWFLLDSVDEARLNRRDVGLALMRLAAELGDGYARARILVSCRGSAWEGKADLRLILEALPLPSRHEGEVAVEQDDPLFPESSRVSIASHRASEEREDDLLLVRLAGLSQVQRTAMLRHVKVEDPEAFERELGLKGLEALAERPGDLLSLAGYWRKHNRLGDLTAMLDFSVEQRLAETNSSRRALSRLSAESARAGAERLAAAMTLSQTMDLLAGAPSEGQAGDACDPDKVLADWLPAEIADLLARGLFIPSSFGRLRFFHRSAQEFLTAGWLRRLRPGLSAEELRRIVLAAPFGVPTVVPSLGPAAAWLAQDDASLRADLLEREPLILLDSGDPGRLPLGDKERLLQLYAERDLEGQLSDRSLDSRSLWMFADEALAPAINRAVELNRRPQFTFEMLRLVEQGRISGCRAFVRKAAIAPDTERYARIVAARALLAMGDQEGLAALADWLLRAEPPLDPRLVPWLAVILYPSFICTTELLELVRSTRAARRFQVEGFREELLQLYEAAPTVDDRRKIVDGLAGLAFDPPHDDWPALSTRNAVLIAQCGPLARAAIGRAEAEGITPGLLRLLRAVGYAGDQDSHADEGLSELLDDHPAIKEALFWADVAEARHRREQPVRSHFDIDLPGRQLWRLGQQDRQWLEAALNRDATDDRLLALDVLVWLARQLSDPEDALDTLAGQVGSNPLLADALVRLRAPRVPTAAQVEQDKRWAEMKVRQEDRQAAERAFWLEFRSRLQGEPDALRNPNRLREWPGSAHDLWRLMQWLRKHGDGSRDAAASRWKQLERAFGLAVAEAYRDGMKIMWRQTPARRPGRRGDLRTIRYDTMIAFAGLALEASDDPDWIKRLDKEEARQAAEHACLDDQGIPEWLGGLLEVWPDPVLPIVAAEMRREWHSGSQFAPLLERAAGSLPLRGLEPVLLNLLGRPPRRTERLEVAARILARLSLTIEYRTALARTVRMRLKRASQAGNRDLALSHLGWLFRLDPADAAERLGNLVEQDLGSGDIAKAAGLLRAFFNRHRGSVTDPSKLPTKLLLQLLRLGYRIAPPTHVDEDDWDFRDPRETLLSGLLGQAPESAYPALIELSRDPVLGPSGHRMLELAHRVAERAAEPGPWQERDIVEFERTLRSPISSGHQLLDLACDLIDDMQRQFDRGDMSERTVIALATTEGPVRDWLGPKIELMSAGRIRCYRESQVANAKRPDLIASAGDPAVELAIELKHAGQGWTLSDLIDTLHRQIARQYLHPTRRRHGLLVISNHRAGRFWIDRKRGGRLTFAQLIDRLTTEAEAIKANASGAIRIAVRGLDVSGDCSAEETPSVGRAPGKRSGPGLSAPGTTGDASARKG